MAKAMSAHKLTFEGTSLKSKTKQNKNKTKNRKSITSTILKFDQRIEHTNFVQIWLGNLTYDMGTMKVQLQTNSRTKLSPLIPTAVEWWWRIIIAIQYIQNTFWEVCILITLCCLWLQWGSSRFYPHLSYGSTEAALANLHESVTCNILTSHERHGIYSRGQLLVPEIV